MNELAVSYPRSEPLDLFLALHRELVGRCSWEVSLLPRPVEPHIAAFRSGLHGWRRLGLAIPPALLGQVDDLPSMLRRSSGDLEATRTVVEAMTAAEPVLRPALASFHAHRAGAAADLDCRLHLDRASVPLAAALGVHGGGLSLPIYLVPFAPHPPSVGFLLQQGQPVGGYVDCRRYLGSTLAEAVLIQLAWALLRTRPGPADLLSRLRALLPGDGPYPRRLRLVLAKVLVEMTAGHLVRREDARHRPGVDILGTAWRFPRLYDLACRHWGRYLDGTCDRDEALMAIARESGSRHPRWYVDHVDAASLAADFYLMEWLGSQGDAAARARLARWTPALSRDLATQLDLIIGTELGHYECARPEVHPPRLAGFLRTVTSGDSRVAWWQTRVDIGEANALSLAAEAFAGPGVEYGGEAWAPIATMLRRFVSGELPQRVFVDQCFTLQHNNGCLFDKYFEAEHLPVVLDAQAAGDLVTLARFASPEVRWRFQEQRRRVHAGFSTAWLDETLPDQPVAGPPVEWTSHRGRLAIGAAPPGCVGCGSSEDLGSFAATSARAGEPVRLRTWQFRRPWPAQPRRYERAHAILETTLGQVRLRLWPQLVPYTVDNFVALAAGTRDWRDPDTGRPRRGPFYDGTLFYRRVPGFLVAAGDRSGTGSGGPGYRIPDEFPTGVSFDRPFLVAMANNGRDSAGSRFFITLAPAPHLDGGYQQFGEVFDERSCAAVTAIAAARDPVVLTRVIVDAR
jgi:cyclophilin family peptidyl-prolyl cis-trans isomerase